MNIGDAYFYILLLKKPEKYGNCSTQKRFFKNLEKIT